MFFKVLFFKTDFQAWKSYEFLILKGILTSSKLLFVIFKKTIMTWSIENVLVKRCWNPSDDKIKSKGKSNLWEFKKCRLVYACWSADVTGVWYFCFIEFIWMFPCHLSRSTLYILDGCVYLKQTSNFGKPSTVICWLLESPDLWDETRESVSSAESHPNVSIWEILEKT